MKLPKIFHRKPDEGTYAYTDQLRCGVSGCAAVPARPVIIAQTWIAAVCVNHETLAFQREAIRNAREAVGE